MSEPEQNPAYRHGYARGGKQRAPEYHAWAGMKQRCHNPKDALFKYYGARGIAVASEWRARDGFRAFLEHIGPRPGTGFSVDRIDNDRGYEPGNVRWASRRVQMLNTRRARMVTINGETLPMKVWCERLNLPYKAVHLRITRRGMTPVEALLTPMRGRR